MVINAFKRGYLAKKLSSVEEESRRAFSKIKREFNDHLEAINENTNEIQSNYEFLVRLENKVDKIEQNLVDINRFIAQFRSQNVYYLDDMETNSFTIDPLTDEEKRVFKVLYELEAEEIKVTYKKLADTLGVGTSIVREYVLALIEKGVPIMKRYMNQQVYLALEPQFKICQTKHNVVKL